MNAINPEKLYHSKWTAAQPERREKHFMVTGLWRDENEHVVEVTLEAVLTGRSVRMHWRALKDASRWRFGWQ